MSSSLAGYAGRELVWMPSKASKRTYELRDGEQVLATLAQPSMWREQYTATAGGGAWNLARQGFWRPQIVVADTASGQPVASIARDAWRGNGSLTLPDGRSYLWRSGSFWGAKWSWLDANQQPVMHFHQTGAFKPRCAVTIAPDAASDPNLPLLAIVGWFLMQLTNNDNAATGAAITSAAIGA